MNTVVKIQPKDVASIAFQEASLDIWDKKYRLTAKDGSPIPLSVVVVDSEAPVESVVVVEADT